MNSYYNISKKENFFNKKIINFLKNKYINLYEYKKAGFNYDYISYERLFIDKDYLKSFLSAYIKINYSYKIKKLRKNIFQNDEFIKYINSLFIIESILTYYPFVDIENILNYRNDTVLFQPTSNEFEIQEFLQQIKSFNKNNFLTTCGARSGSLIVNKNLTGRKKDTLLMSVLPAYCNSAVCYTCETKKRTYTKEKIKSAFKVNNNVKGKVALAVTITTNVSYFNHMKEDKLKNHISDKTIKFFKQVKKKIKGDNKLTGFWHIEYKLSNKQEYMNYHVHSVIFDFQSLGISYEELQEIVNRMGGIDIKYLNTDKEILKRISYPFKKFDIRLSNLSKNKQNLINYYLSNRPSTVYYNFNIEEEEHKFIKVGTHKYNEDIEKYIFKLPIPFFTVNEKELVESPFHFEPVLETVEKTYYPLFNNNITFKILHNYSDKKNYYFEVEGDGYEFSFDYKLLTDLINFFKYGFSEYANLKRIEFKSIPPPLPPK